MNPTSAQRTVTRRIPLLVLLLSALLTGCDTPPPSPPTTDEAITQGATTGYQIGDPIDRTNPGKQTAAPKEKTPPDADRKTGADATIEYREIEWDELIPPDWDPVKVFEGLDLDTLDDADPRAMEALERLQAEWNNAPANTAIAGTRIRIPGFAVPLESDRDGLREFLLVPYFGACIHTPPPPANQIVHVILDKAATGIQAMDAVWVDGTLETTHSVTEMGDASYFMRADSVALYE